MLQIFTLQTLVDSSNSYQESLAVEHVDHRILQLQKIFQDYIPFSDDKGSHRSKNTGIYEILSQNGDPPAPYCFYEILIQIFPLILR